MDEDLAVFAAELERVAEEVNNHLNESALISVDALQDVSRTIINWRYRESHVFLVSNMLN